MKYRIAIVEDDRRYRVSLERLIASAQDLQLAGSYGCAEDALRAATRQGAARPWDLVLMDLELPGMSGTKATRRLKEWWPRVQVVVLTVFEEPSTVLEAICSGADGYLSKSVAGKEILDQARIVLGGGGSLTPGVARTLLELVRNPLPRPRDAAAAPGRVDLTDRERDVLRGLVQGLAYKQIASTLGISIDTVRSHVKHVYRKLQVHGVAEAVGRAIREKLV
ncbi:MAG: response regulator transcription factor [Acidobacteriota bacterium]|jgi:DNA-binding NarL/FixJ family response regulator